MVLVLCTLPDNALYLYQVLPKYLTVFHSYRPGAHFTKHLKPKIFVSSIQFVCFVLYGTYENLRLKLFSETGTWTLGLTLGWSQLLTDGGTDVQMDRKRIPLYRAMPCLRQAQQKINFSILFTY